jgi:predicted DNA-binding protein with PD1-like motif
MSDKPKTVENFPWNIWQKHEGTYRYHSAEGQPGRIISGRLLPGCDFVQGIIQVARSHGVKAAWVNGFGSLAKAVFSPAIQLSESMPDRVERQPNMTLPGSIEMWSGMGRLGVPDSGEPFIHFHGMVTTPDGRIYGGHFFPGGNTVYATFEVHIQEILGLAFKLELDAEVELPLIEPKEKKMNNLQSLIRV